MRSFGDLNLEQQEIWFPYLEIKVAGLGSHQLKWAPNWHVKAGAADINSIEG